MIIIPHRFTGRIRLNTVNKTTGIKRYLTPWFHNLVLDTGLDLITQSSNWLDYCHVGSSDISKETTQTSLIEPIASTSIRIQANNLIPDTAPYAGISRITYEFPTGSLNGMIKEIGFGPSNILESDLFNRSLIEDEFGNQSYITVNSNEALQVQYELSVFSPQNDITGTVLVDGIAVGYTARAANANSAHLWCPYNADNYQNSGQASRAIFDTIPGTHIVAYDGPIGSNIETPIGNNAPATYLTTIPYISGNHQSLIRAEWDIHNANFENGIKSLYWSFSPIVSNGGNNFGGYQVEFDSPIMKTNEENFRFDLGISWSRT